MGEANRLYSIFTLNRGKIEAVADGSAKIKSKLAGDLEPFNFCRLMIAQGRYFDRLAGARKASQPNGNKKDLTAIIFLWALAEGLNNLLISHLPEEKLYYLNQELVHYLSEDFELEEKVFLTIQFFWLNYLFMGYRPEIINTKEEWYFNKPTGHIHKSISDSSGNQAKKIPKGLLEVLKEIDDNYHKKQGLYMADRLERDNLNFFYLMVVDIYQAITNRPFNSFKFLKYV